MSVAAADDDDPDAELAEIIADDLVTRRTTVMFLRNGGASWARVAAAVGVSIATARKDYQIVCRDINREDPSMTLARHRAVIFDICRANYGRMMEQGSEHSESATKAAMVILKALEAERKLLGMEQPVRLLATVNTEDFAVEAARLIAFIQQNDANTLKELTRGQDPAIIDADMVADPAAPPDQPATEPEPGRGDGNGPGAANAGRAVPPDNKPLSAGGGHTDRDQPLQTLGGDQGGGSAAEPLDDGDGWSNIGD